MATAASESRSSQPQQPVLRGEERSEIPSLPEVSGIQDTIQKFKEEYRQMDKSDLRYQVPYLKELAEHYRQKYDVGHESNWTDLLKAHSLYNSCAARLAYDADKSNTFKQEAFNIQRLYWGDLCPDMDGEEQKTITEKLKTDLTGIRSWTEDELNKVGPIIDKFDCQPGNLQSDGNKATARKWVENMTRISKQCNEKMVEFTRDIVKHAIEVCGTPPCDFSLATMGSAAKGETTPYSDLEFFILIKESSEDIVRYFETLSMSMYFLIGNLGETNLKYMNIEELRQDKWFEDTCTNGFKIDGLLPSAGNIPTGNGCKTQSKNRFIKTVEELVKDYIDVFDNPDEETAICGDLSAMMAFTKHVTGSEAIHEQFRTALELISPSERRQLVSQNMLIGDTKKFDFDFTDDITRLIDLKTGIYRYPSLLVHDLKVINQVQAKSSWDAIDQMADKQIFSKDVSLSLKFALAVAQFVRLDAYTFQRSQVNHISVLAPEKGSFGGPSPWHFPRQLLTFLVFHLIPIKSSLSLDLSSVSGLITEIRIDEELLIPLVSFYCEDYGAMLCLIGERRSRWYKMNDKLKEIYLSALLKTSTYEEFHQALDSMFGESTAYPLANRIRKKTWQARLFERKSQFLEAWSCYDEKLNIYKDTSGCASTDDVATTWEDLARVQYKVGRYHDSRASIEESLKMRQAMQSTYKPIDCLRSLRRKTLVLMQLGEIEQAKHCGDKNLAMCRALHNSTNAPGIDDGAAHHDIADAYITYGRVLSADDDYHSALEYLERGLNMYQEIYGNVNHVEIAYACTQLGTAHRKNHDHKKARSYFDRALHIYESLFGDTPNPDAAFVKQCMGQLLLLKGRLKQAMEASETSLEMRQKLYGDHPHHDVAFSHDTIGKIFRKKKKHKKALEHLQRSLEIRKRVFGRDAHHPSIVTSHNLISSLHLGSKSYGKAFQHAEESLKLNQHRFPKKPHSSTAQSLQCIGDICMAWRRDELALKHYKQSLEMFSQLTSTGQASPPVSISIHHSIIIILKRTDKCQEALEHAEEALKLVRQSAGGELSKQATTTLTLMGQIHSEQGSYNEALASYNNGLEEAICLDKPDAKYQIVMLRSYIGTMHRKLEEVNLALKSHLEALEEAEKLYGDKPHRLKASIYCNIGNDYDCLGDLERARHFLQKSLDENQNLGAHRKATYKAYVSSKLSNVLKRLNRFDKALIYAKYALRLSNKLSKGTADPHVANAHELIGGIYECQGRVEDAATSLSEALKIYQTLHEQKALFEQEIHRLESGLVRLTNA